MEALRLIKTLKTMEVEELAPFVGQKIEIIAFPVTEESDVVEGTQVFEFIDLHSSTIPPFNKTP